MAQFFLKMAKASKAKKLGPGASIPGCNSYFLNKYLKVSFAVPLFVGVVFHNAVLNERLGSDKMQR